MFEMKEVNRHRAARPIDIVVGGLMAIVSKMRDEARIRTEIAKASALDDHLLADIAVARCDIKHAVRGETERLGKVIRG